MNTTQLEQELAKLNQGDHICSIQENQDEQITVTVNFIKDGLKKGERCLYIKYGFSFENISQALASVGIDVETEIKRGHYDY